MDVNLHYQDILSIAQMPNIIMGSQESKDVFLQKYLTYTLASLNNYLLTSLGITIRVITVGNIHFGNQCVSITGESHYLFYMSFKLIGTPLVPMGILYYPV